MSLPTETVERELVKVENALVNKATMIESMDDLLTFYFTYLTHYIPMLEYSVECLPENSIAKLANFGMLVDHICSLKIDNVLATQVETNAIEISKKTGKPKSEIIKILNEITTSHKIQIASSLVISTSLSRDATLCAANSKFNAINKIIVWANMFRHFFHFPILLEQLISSELIEEAEKDLSFAKTRIQKKDRSYDYDLSGEWFDCVDLPRQVIQESPKYFIGPKLAWLEAMEGLELAKCILNRDKEAGAKALLYNQRIIRILKNKNFTMNEWAFRNFNSSGPNCHIENLISNAASKDGAHMSVIDNHTIFIQSPTHRFFIIVPSWFRFYTNPGIRVHISEELSIPITRDLGAIVAFYKNPAKFVVDNIRNLSMPDSSDYLLSKEKDKEKIEELIKAVDSIVTRLAITFTSKINMPIAKVVEEVSNTGVEGITIYGLLLGLEKVISDNHSYL